MAYHFLRRVTFRRLPSAVQDLYAIPKRTSSSQLSAPLEYSTTQHVQHDTECSALTNTRCPLGYHASYIVEAILAVLASVFQQIQRTIETLVVSLF